MPIVRRILLSLIALVALTSSAFAGRSVNIGTLVVAIGGVEFARYADSQADQDWLSSWRRSSEYRTVVLAGKSPDGRTVPTYSYDGCRISQIEDRSSGGIARLTINCAKAEAK